MADHIRQHPIDVDAKASDRWLPMALLAGLAIVADAASAAQDPWPFWGRTTTRVANTSTVGPQTETIQWSIQISDQSSDFEASPVLDGQGRLFIGTGNGATAVDTTTRKLMWQATPGDITRGVAVWGGRVVWGDVPPFSNLYCRDAATGDELWTRQIGFALYAAPVIDPDGVIYITDVTDAGAQVLHARRIEDGSEVLTIPLADHSHSSPSLDWPVLLTSAGEPTSRDLVGLNPLTGESRWTFRTANELFGTAIIADHRGVQDKALRDVPPQLLTVSRDGKENADIPGGGGVDHPVVAESN